MTQRAALYARVSTTRQQEDRTVASQVAALEKAAEGLGLVVCGQCGLRMICERQTRSHHPYEYFYYACERRSPEDTGRPERCTAKRVRAPELDAVVWKALCDWLQQPQMLLKEVETWQLSHQHSQAAQQETARLEGACRHLQGQIDRLVDAYQQGAIEVDELKARRQRLEASLQATRARAQSLEAQHADGARLERLAADIAAFAAAIRDGLEALDFAGRQRLVRLLVERVIVQGEDVTIEHAVPLSGRFTGLRPEDRGVRLRQVRRQAPGAGVADSSRWGACPPGAPGTALAAWEVGPGSGATPELWVLSHHSYARARQLHALHHEPSRGGRAPSHSRGVEARLPG